MGSTPLTIGACHVNGFEFLMWIAQCFTKPDGIGEIFLVSRSTDALKHGQVVVQILNGVGIAGDHAGNNNAI